MKPIRCRADLERELDYLCRLAPELAPIRKRVEREGPVPLRLEGPGFVPLVETICAQQISRASATAIFERLKAAIDPLTPESLAAMDEKTARAVGLSRPKEATLRATAGAVMDGRLDLDAACRMEAGDAIAHITAVPGLGPWTAGVFLLFCGGHPDILPAADVALQTSAADALGRQERLSARELDRVARAWSPHRAAASRLLWANYAVLKGREVLP